MNRIESKNRKALGWCIQCVSKNFVKALYHHATLQEIQDTNGVEENAKCDMAIETYTVFYEFVQRDF